MFALLSQSAKAAYQAAASYVGGSLAGQTTQRNGTSAPRTDLSSSTMVESVAQLRAPLWQRGRSPLSLARTPVRESRQVMASSHLARNNASARLGHSRTVAAMAVAAALFVAPAPAAAQSTGDLTDVVDPHLVLDVADFALANPYLSFGLTLAGGLVIITAMTYGGSRLVSRAAQRRGANAKAPEVASPEPQRTLLTSQNAFLALRLAAIGFGLGDFVPDGSLDTLFGAMGAMYGANLAFSALIGTNLRGLDVAMPLSFAAFQMIRFWSGAYFFDLAHLNFNHFFFFRFVAELGNYLTMLPMLGRFYLRPDLRQGLAAGYNMTANASVGARMDYGAPARWAQSQPWVPQQLAGALMVLDRIPKAPLLGLLIDLTLARMLRAVSPRTADVWLQPITLWGHSSSHPVLRRLAGIFIKGHGGASKDDLMKPQMTYAGSALTLVQGLAINIPYQGALAVFQGMDPYSWMANRIGKMVLWSTFGQPTKVRLGGDLPRAQLAGFMIGIFLMDLPMSLLFNPRYSALEWAPGFHDDLTAVMDASDSERVQVIQERAEEILDDVVVEQMTAWDPVAAVTHWGETGELRIGFYQERFLATLANEVAKLSEPEKAALDEVVTALINMQPDSSIEQEGIQRLSAIVFHTSP